MIKIRFITDGKPHGWRYQTGDEVLLPDRIAQEAIEKKIAIKVDESKPLHATSAKALGAIAEAKDRSLK